MSLHRLIRTGDLDGLRAALGAGAAVDEFDWLGHTPLMCAVSTGAPLDCVRLLLAHGASVHLTSRIGYEGGRGVLSLAIKRGLVATVALLIEHGAPAGYRYSAGYDALLDAAHSDDLVRNPELAELVRLLLAHGAAVDTVSGHDEAALSGFSAWGRFDVVKLMLDGGAPVARLRWSELHHAVAFGSVEDVARRAARPGIDLEARDRGSRTPFVMAVQTGDIGKAEALLARGAVFDALSYCGRPALFHAIENHRDAMLAWLLAHGALPLEVERAWADASQDVIDLIAGSALSEPANGTMDGQSSAIARVRLHADCHLGNILWTPTDRPGGGPHFVDLDDCRSGPAVQDLWMLLPGERAERQRALVMVLDGYEQVRPFDRRELALIEPLRTLRLIHYSAWLAQRWSDPAFPLAFPDFGSVAYWRGQIDLLRAQAEAIEEPPLVA